MIALQTLAVKAFGDMGQTARLCLIRDRFIAGHSSCELRRYLDCVPLETPIRDVVDWCRVWESHADPEIRRVSKPIPEAVYPAYVVSESDKGVDDLRVAAVATPQSMPDQIEILFVDCWRVQLLQHRSQLRNLRRWKDCHSVWWRRLRCDSLFRWWRLSRRDCRR